MNEKVILCLELEAVSVESFVESFRPLREGLAQRGICLRSLGEEQARSPET